MSAKPCCNHTNAPQLARPKEPASVLLPVLTQPDPAVACCGPEATQTLPSKTDASVVFGLFLALLGTFPIALGIGVALRPNANSLAEMTSCEVQDDAPVSKIGVAAEAVLDRRHQAGELLRSGRFQLALQQYQSKEKTDLLRSSDQVLFEMAVCHEALRHWDDALAIYRNLASRDASPFRAASLLGQGRIWLCLDEPDKTRDLMHALWLTVDQSQVNVAALSQDAAYFSALAAALKSTPKSAECNGTHPIPPLRDFEWPWSIVLETAVAAAHSGDLTQVADEDRRPTVPSLDSDASVALAGVLAACPNHWLAGQAKLALGHVAYWQGDLDEAVARYGELIGKASTPLSVIAAYNQGIILFRTQEYGPTSVALERVIDGAPGHELYGPALILRGRALLELGESEPAIFDLRRAAGLRGDVQDRDWATVFMGMAYLQHGQPQQAAEAMFRLRDRLETGAARNAAAFVVSLARFEALTKDAREQEAFFLHRALLALDRDAERLGTTGTLLVGRAFQGLGLPEQMADLYSKALEGSVSDPLASEMRFALADYWLATGQSAAGRSQLNALYVEPDNRCSDRAGLRLAEQDLADGRFTDCATLCRELLHREVNHARVLKLMGAAYEQAGDLEQAALCFAGNPGTP